MRWKCFALKLCQVNEDWAREFYANLSAVSLSNPVIRIRGKEVHFGLSKLMEFIGHKVWT